MQVVLISGLSGSGKSVALKVLEDNGYFCVDNLPVKLFAETVELLRTSGNERIAISIDARGGETVSLLPQRVEQLKLNGVDARLLFLDAKDDTLIRRFTETRRRHPLATGQVTLEEAIAHERDLLSPVAEAGHRIDTSGLQPNALRIERGETSLLFESFGYKQGIPLDADFVFDVRCLPNPFYDPQLRPLTGRDAAVIAFLEKEPSAGRMLADIRTFIENWLPAFRRDNRGRHRLPRRTASLGLSVRSAGRTFPRPARRRTGSGAPSPARRLIR